LTFAGGLLVLAVLVQISLGVATVHWGRALGFGHLAQCRRRFSGDQHGGGCCGRCGRRPQSAWYPCIIVPTIPDNPPLAVVGTSRWRDFFGAHQAKVSLLIVFTAVVGMVLGVAGVGAAAPP